MACISDFKKSWTTVGDFEQVSWYWVYLNSRAFEYVCRNSIQIIVSCHFWSGYLAVVVMVSSNEGKCNGRCMYCFKNLKISWSGWYNILPVFSDIFIENYCQVDMLLVRVITFLYVFRKYVSKAHMYDRCYFLTVTLGVWGTEARHTPTSRRKVFL